MPVYYGMFATFGPPPPVTGRPHRDRAKNKAAKQARRRNRRP